MRHLKNLGDSFQVPILADESGYVGRECPNNECEGYFKIKFGTGIQESIPCTCPYCGHSGDQSSFMTKDQIEYIKSFLMSKVTGALQKDFAEWNRKNKQTNRNNLFSISFEFKAKKHPIHYYREKKLETDLICDRCGLHYSIYGIFSYCPDCNIHNSLQILNKNLDIAEKQLHLSETIENDDLSETLLADSLENAVSVFDAFGRELCKANANKTQNPELIKNISFQNLDKANINLQKYFNINLENNFKTEWPFLIKCFQKRHLLAHKMGVVDEHYLEVTSDTLAVKDRKISITPEEIRELLKHLRSVGNFIHTNI